MSAEGPMGQMSQMRDQPIIDNADIIHAPADPSQFDRGYTGPTSCGKALRACSDDITTITNQQFEALEGDDRRCHECITMS